MLNYMKQSSAPPESKIRLLTFLLRFLLILILFISCKKMYMKVQEVF